MPEPSIIQVTLVGLILIAACAAIAILARRHWDAVKAASKPPAFREDIGAGLDELLAARLEFLRSSTQAERAESDAAQWRTRSREALARIDRLEAYLRAQGDLCAGIKPPAVPTAPMPEGFAAGPAEAM